MTDPLRAARKPTPTEADQRIARVVAKLYGFDIFADRPLTIPEDLRAVWFDGWEAARDKERSNGR